MVNLSKLVDADINNKRVFVRGDIDVPLTEKLEAGSKKFEISDDTRLRDIWPTIEYLLSKNCEVTLGGHLGRPGGKVDPALSSVPVKQWFIEKTNGNSKLQVLENLRFDPREETNDESYAKQLAQNMDVYVNEAFASSAGEHASIVGLPKLLPHYAGLRLAKEIEVLEKLVSSPQRPMLAIIGGAKLDTKIPVISSLSKVADNVIVGGKLLTEIMSGSPIMGMANVRLLQLTPDTKDTVLNSIDAVMNLISNAATIVWNGPMGAVEDFTYQVGSRRVAELVSAAKGYKVLGGGDTIGFVNKLGLTDKFDWVSSGGGAMLKMLSGEKLIGIEALLQ